MYILHIFYVYLYVPFNLQSGHFHVFNELAEIITNGSVITSPRSFMLSMCAITWFLKANFKSSLKTLPFSLPPSQVMGSDYVIIFVDKSYIHSIK